MKAKWILQVFALVALASTTAMCESDDLEDETEEVIDAQQEAAEVAEENPGDTAAIREAGQEVEEEQREAASAMREALEEKGVDTTNVRPSTTRD
jgi:hypothetical protein